MTIAYRDAELGDAAALRELFAEIFVETFGHLYRPADLKEFLDGNSLSKWEVNLGDQDVAIRVVEADGEVQGFVEVAPKKLPYETAAPALELRRLYLRSSAH